MPDMWNVCVRGFGGRKPEGGKERERERALTIFRRR